MTLEPAPCRWWESPVVVPSSSRRQDGQVLTNRVGHCDLACAVACACRSGEGRGRCGRRWDQKCTRSEAVALNQLRLGLQGATGSTILIAQFVSGGVAVEPRKLEEKGEREERYGRGQGELSNRPRAEKLGRTRSGTAWPDGSPPSSLCDRRITRTQCSWRRVRR